MLLADGRPEPGPADVFKTGRVAVPNHKQVAEKVTNINHFDNKNLLTVAEVRKDYQQHVKWSQQAAEFNCKERLFDKIIAAAKLQEANDLRRETETEALLHQRKRGMKKDEAHHNSNHSIGVVNKQSIQIKKPTVTKPNPASAENSVMTGKKSVHHSDQENVSNLNSPIDLA
jgi:hypothetical protein